MTAVAWGADFARLPKCEMVLVDFGRGAGRLLRPGVFDRVRSGVSWDWRGRGAGGCVGWAGAVPRSVRWWLRWGCAVAW